MVDYKDVINALSKLGGDPAQAYELFGQRGYEAWQIVKERRVKKYIFKPSGKTQWIVVGKCKEHILYPVVGYCHCDDFFFQVMEGKALACQHLVAQKLAVSLNMYDTIEEDDNLFATLIEEWKKFKQGTER